MLTGKWTCLALILLVSFSFVLTSEENDFDEDDSELNPTRKKSRRRTTRKPRNKRTRRPRRPKPAAEQACPSYGPEPASGPPVSMEDQKTILYYMNGIRRNTAKGIDEVTMADNEVITPPPAERMEILKWNVNLATDAQSWADKCAEERQEMPLKQSFDRVHQIFFDETRDGQIDWFGAIASIGEEGPKNFDIIRAIDKYTPFTEKTPGTVAADNYIQIIWANSTDVGCGYTEYFKPNAANEKSKNSTQVFVCNFGPGGNVEGEPIYKKKTEDEVSNFTCPTPDVTATVNEDDESTILFLINNLRSEIAAGTYVFHTDQSKKRGIVLPAGKIPDLVWDKDLARDAQKWAESCASERNLMPDAGNFTQANQIFYQYTGPSKKPQDWFSVFVKFLEEGQGAFTLDVIDNYTQANYNQVETARLTQVFWGETKAIGCGYAPFSKCPGFLTQNFVCNFGPAGNVEGQPIYIKNNPST